MQLTVLIVVVCLGVASEALVCPPGVCAAVSCVAVENCEGKVTNSGFCGCCPVCVKQLGENESCMSSLFVGIPSTSECGEGLECDLIHTKCVKKVTKRDMGSCTKAHMDYLQKSTNGGFQLGALDPVCKADGSYESVQCSDNYCFCATPEGKKITGYSAKRPDSTNMNCKCAIEQHNYMQGGLIGKLFYCDTNGNYSNYQCVGSVCWCRGQDGSKSVNIGNLDTLNC